MSHPNQQADKSDNSSNTLEVYTDEDIREARAILWEQGILEWKLDPCQKKIFDFLKSKQDKTLVMNASRRIGKTYCLVVLAFEHCIKFPKSIVKFIQPEVSMIRKNIRPIFDEIIFDCPLELSPEFKTQDNIYVFPNGSQIQLAGTDNGNYMKLRGGQSHLAIIDEAGFCTDLNHIINQILIPTTTLTRGKIILSSTTPDKMDHEFNDYMVRAETEGRLIRKTIYDAIDDHKEMEKPRITLEIIEDIIKGYNEGTNAQEFKTEYLCQLPENVSSRVIPEFTKEVEKDVVCKWVRPAFYDAYVSMDIGFVDLTAVLFGYYDFTNGVLVVEDEFSINGPKMTSRKLAELIMQTEDRLYTNAITGEFVKPYMRVSDNNMILLNDLQREYNLTFLPTEKHNKDAYINQLRNLIGERRIIINPKCTQLISHLQLATWEKSRKDYKRSADSGHYDFIDSLVYMVRNLDMQRNPFPKGFHHSLLGSPGNVFKGGLSQNNSNKSFDKLENMFKVKTTFKRTK